MGFLFNWKSRCSRKFSPDVSLVLIKFKLLEHLTISVLVLSTWVKETFTQIIVCLEVRFFTYKLKTFETQNLTIQELNKWRMRVQVWSLNVISQGHIQKETNICAWSIQNKHFYLLPFAIFDTNRYGVKCEGLLKLHISW